MEVICAAYRSAFEHREIRLPLEGDFDMETFFRNIKPRIPPRYRQTPAR
ncbi:MAG: hypothetical protein FJY97_00555 [candidate division Zixibacteria bacterium]|nr:hypothetical protein [candidate division Zixibacteria bacterium]